jgi:peptide/nickel transport system permease protein
VDTATRPGIVAGALLLGALTLMAIAAPVLAPNDPAQRFSNLLYAPPTAVHVWRDGPSRPFIYAPRLISRIERRFDADRTHPVPLRWLSHGRLVTTDVAGAPLLLLGADAYGRDIFARLLYAARISLALAFVSAIAAVAIGTLLGGVAGYAGGWIDALLSRSSEFILVLPTMYVALVLRAMLPLTLAAGPVFVMLTTIFAMLGWPVVARGVRAIVRSEREREYAMAARALGMSPIRVLTHHLLPASAGYLTVQFTLLVPAFIVAEATLSYVGFGFPQEFATWGTMLQEAANVLLVADAPWLLAPAIAIFLSVVAVNLLVQATGRPPVQLER